MAELRGLYAITPPRLEGTALAAAVEAALAGGCRILQYRYKGTDGAGRLRDALTLAELCRRHDALFIVNDDPELALACGAHGVHLGRDDTPYEAARRRLGAEAIIGLSCYADFERARWAAGVGADYLAFGAFYPSTTKPGAVRAHPELLRRAGRELGRPLVAIGGITPENALPLIAAGAQMVAVIQGLFAQPDIEAAARRFADLFAIARGPS